MQGNAMKRRRRVSGVLNHASRGPSITTDAGDLWVLESDDVDPDLAGRRVTAEGTATGFDRLRVDWIGETQP